MSYLTDLISNLGFTATPQTRSVRILDQDYNFILPQVNMIDVRVKQDKQAMQHTIEDGSIITDYTIVRPTEIDLIIVLNTSDYQDVYFTILGYYENSTLLTIQTKTAIYDNQFLVSMPHTETAEMYNAIGMILRFQQAIIVKAQYNVTPKYPSNSTTVNRGQQQGTSANDQQEFEAAQSFFNNENKYELVQ